MTSTAQHELAETGGFAYNLLAAIVTSLAVCSPNEDVFLEGNPCGVDLPARSTVQCAAVS